MPNVLLEAMACGTPAVGFNVGGIAEYVIPQQTGLLAQPGDTHELAAKISILKLFANSAPAMVVLPA